MTIVEARPAADAPHLSRTRDPGIDLMRAVCVVGVVLLHGIMVGVTVSDGQAVFDNASVGTWWIVPVSWLLQVMPLFFVIGGFSGLLAYRRSRERGATSAAFVAARLHRLVRPAAVTIAVAGAMLFVLTAVGLPGEQIAVAGFRFGQPLWFLAVFLLCQALLPALVALHDRAPGLTVIALVVAATGTDVLRLATGIEALGFFNLAFVWLALQQVGFFLADGRIDRLGRRLRGIVGAGAAVLLLAAFCLGVYSPDLIENINPPTTAMLLVGAIHTSLLSLHRHRLRLWSGRPFAAAVSRFVTRRAMTIYLWHMPVLLAMAGATAAIALSTGAALAPIGSLGWWSERPVWLITALALTAAVALGMGAIEERQSPRLTGSARRVTVATLLALIAIVLLLGAGTTPGTAAVAVALLLVALRCSADLSSARSPLHARV
jgi:peptidoglycan/LPS O-acetylase OafA/YrhL